MQANVAAERRSQTERRALTWRAFLYGFRRGRRRQPRREPADGVPLIDVFHPTWLLLTVVILVLSISDALFTLRLLHGGATELNPIMDHLIRLDRRAFVLVKLVLTIGGCLVLNRIGYFQLFRHFRVRQVFILILISYGSLVTYELALLLIAR